MSDSRRQSTADVRRQSIASENTKYIPPQVQGQFSSGLSPSSSNAGALAGRSQRPSSTAQGRQAVDSFRRQSITTGARVSNMGGKGHRSSRTTMGSRVNVQSSGFPMDRVQVLDDDGVDRTPKPLILLKPTVTKGVPGFSTDYDSHTPTSDVSENFLDRISSSGFGRGGFSASTSGTQTPMEAEEEDDYNVRKGREQQQAQAWKDARNDDNDESPSRWKPNEPDQPTAAAPLTEEDLDKSVYINLTETDTLFLLNIAGVSVHVESEDAKQVEEGNARYHSLLVAKEGSDKYVDGAAQTLGVLKKNKEVQIACPTTAGVSCQVSLWDLSDTYTASIASTSGQDEQQHMSIMDAAATVTTGSGSSVPAGAAAPNANVGSACPSMRQSRCDYTGGGYLARESSGMLDSSPFSDTGMHRLQEQGPGSGGASGDPGTADMVAVSPLLHLKGLADALAIMDAAITQNIYLEKLLMYRDVEPLLLRPAAAPTAEGSASTSDWPGSGAAPGAVAGSGEWDNSDLQPSTSADQAAPSTHVRTSLLWRWTCPLTAGRNVSCMGWNKARPDLLAVGYGSFHFGAQHEGLVAFWSLKNPAHPLWTIPTSSGVMSLDFASHSPNILAVGLYDGRLAVYDVKNKLAVPAMESSAGNGKHSDPVWKVRWLDRGPEREEVLVSISSDGRITQWSITKGLDFTDLMKLKRVVRRTASSSASGGAAAKAGGGGAAGAGHKAAAEEQEAFISRLTSGMSFDFSSRDDRMYIAGTEDGWIHKCSTSYSEQYLGSYQGHMGPVYQVQWSPFKPDFFLSCSGDWTVRLWQEQRTSSLVVFQSGSEEVNDVQWSPFSSTVFGAVTGGGRLEIWDFAESTLKPVAMHEHAGSKLSCVLFSPTSPVVMCGGDDGAVSVHRIYYTDSQVSGRAEQLRLMDEALHANVMKTEPGQAAHSE